MGFGRSRPKSCWLRRPSFRLHHTLPLRRSLLPHRNYRRRYSFLLHQRSRCSRRRQPLRRQFLRPATFGFCPGPASRAGVVPRASYHVDR
jgi:hypothetical protein